MQKYIWTKKRKKARKNLLVFIVVLILISYYSPMLPELRPNVLVTNHPIFTTIYVVLIFLGCFSIADDIITLLVYSEDD